MLPIESVKKEIDLLLDSTFSQEREKARKIDQTYADLVEASRVFILRGGKRLRPYLTYLTHLAFTAKEDNQVFCAGAALEIFHNFLLVHDDIIDRDYMRYGGENIEGYFLRVFREGGVREPEHSALVAAVLAGDFEASMARSLLYSLPINPEAKLELLQMLDEVLIMVCGGEYVDTLAAAIRKESLDTHTIESIYIHKTAHYSFDLPLQVGAVLAGASAEQRKLLREFAIPLGIAFQARDDYIGLFGDTAVTGKPITSDLREGKQTLYFALLLEQLNEDEKKQLALYYGNPNADEKAVLWVRTLCQERGIVEVVDTRIHELVHQALTALTKLKFNKEVEGEFRKFVQFCTQRNG